MSFAQECRRIDALETVVRKCVSFCKRSAVDIFFRTVAETHQSRS